MYICLRMPELTGVCIWRYGAECSSLLSYEASGYKIAVPELQLACFTLIVWILAARTNVWQSRSMPYRTVPELGLELEPGYN